MHERSGKSRCSFESELVQRRRSTCTARSTAPPSLRKRRTIVTRGQASLASIRSAEVLLVVAQADVEGRAVLLDQLVLEQQRFLHVGRDDDLDDGGALDEGRNPDPPVAAGDVLRARGTCRFCAFPT